jgi:hypothetical protein
LGGERAWEGLDVFFHFAIAMSENDYSSETEAMLKEIHEAFREMTRVGGVSWTESIAIDEYAEHNRAEYRAKDTETSWTELPDDPNWRVDMGVGGFSFLDPIGFRYYLPAAMIVAARGGYDEGINFHLTLPKKFLREHSLSKWSLLDGNQRRCVRHFIEYMIRAYETRPEWHEEYSLNSWRKAFDSYWKDID